MLLGALPRLMGPLCAPRRSIALLLGDSPRRTLQHCSPQTSSGCLLALSNPDSTQMHMHVRVNPRMWWWATFTSGSVCFDLEMNASYDAVTYALRLDLGDC